MNEYWAAVDIAASFSDETLDEFGGFDFETVSAENGRVLLARFEEMFVARIEDRKKAKQQAQARSIMLSLNAFLGVFGVKTSKLKTDEDYWSVGTALWPQVPERSGELALLQKRIKLLPKKQRRLSAMANIHSVPREFLSEAPKHQKALAKAESASA